MTRPVALLFVALIAALSGCAAGGGRLGGAAADGLVAERLSIHPLTRFGVDAADEPVIICHFELRDGYGQAVRALGYVRVELFRPGAEHPDGSQLQDQVWRLDLSTPERNAARYDDLVTRTYTLALGGLPGWLLAWRAGEGGLGAVSPTIRVTFMRDGEGEGSSELSDVFRMSR